MGLGAESPLHASLFEVLARLPAHRDDLGHAVSHSQQAELAAIAARHGVSALIADALSAAALPVPAQLAQDARSQVARGLKTKRLTLLALDALAQEGITPVVLKGYGLAVRLYPEQPLGRPSTDVDLLVRHEDLPQVALAMKRLGLSPQHDEGLADVFEEHHHLSFSGPAGLVEAHFRLISTLGRGAFDDASIWARARDWALEGRRARLLHEEDEFLYLATHAANHGFLRISWLVDLQRYLASGPALDWSRMAETSSAAGFHTAVSTALHLLERLLKVHLPEGALKHFSPSRLRSAADSRVFSAARIESAQLAEHRVGSFLLRLWLVDSPAHGLRHLVDGARRFVRRTRSEG